MQNKSSFTLVISKVNQLVYTGTAHAITLPGSEGVLTILPGHEPLITILKKGSIVVRDADDTHTFEIESGLLETSHGQVTVLI